MRLSVVILVLCAAVPVSAADIAPTIADAESVTHPEDATLSLARDVLERWERVLTEEGPGRMSASNICRMYLDAWATVDMDRAIELERRYRCRSSQSLLVERLAAAHRWDDVQTIMDADRDEFRHRAPGFWSRVACYGAKIGDLETIDLAGRRVEMQAAAEPSEPGRPPRPSDRIALARFYVAASRLDLLRRQHGALLEIDAEALASETERVQQRERREELRVAIEDLWRAAGSIVPRRSWFLTTPEFSSFQGYAALESWETDSAWFRWAQANPDNFVGGLVTAYRQQRPSAPGCSIVVVLPDLSRPVTSAWLTRQMMLGRVSVALTTLCCAPGSDVDRARNLAVMSRYLPADEAALAASWREAADSILRSIDVVDDSVVRALAELSLACSSAGDFDNASRCIDATFGAYSADGFAPPELSPGDSSRDDADEALAAWSDSDDVQHWATEYDTRQVLLQAAAALPDTHARMSEILQGFADWEFDRSRLPQYDFRVDGLARRMDLTHVIPDSRIRDELRYASHADYHREHDARNWLGAMDAAVRRHAGNPAWARTYRTLAVESVQEIGLAATLEWSADIADPEARFAAEIAATQEAVRAWRKTLPPIDATTPEFVTPAVPWPSGC